MWVAVMYEGAEMMFATKAEALENAWMNSEENVYEVCRVDKVRADAEGVDVFVRKLGARCERAERALERIGNAASMRITDIWLDHNMDQPSFLLQEIDGALEDFETEDEA